MSIFIAFTGYVHCRSRSKSTRSRSDSTKKKKKLPPGAVSIFGSGGAGTLFGTEGEVKKPSSGGLFRDSDEDWVTGSIRSTGSKSAGKGHVTYSGGHVTYADGHVTLSHPESTPKVAKKPTRGESLFDEGAEEEGEGGLFTETTEVKPKKKVLVISLVLVIVPLSLRFM